MRWYTRRGRRDEGLVTASEIASFVYCPEQFRLEYGLGLPAENRAAMDAGARHHSRKAVAERLAGWSVGLGQLIVVAGLVLLLLWALLR
jgi:hypothetical protein